MVTDDCSNGKKEEAPRVTCESLGSSDELTSAQQVARSWDEDEREKSRDGQPAWSHTESGVADFATPPTWKEILWTKKHLLAVLLVLSTAVVPLCILGEATTPPYRGRGWFSGVFGDKVVGCSGGVGITPANTTVTGIETLFALDTTYGAFTFAQVKSIDVLWDIGLGRGLQVLAAWATYNVFCDVLLKVIQRHPTSFSVFQRIALEGPSTGSLSTLVRELWATKSRHTKAIFFYMVLSTLYVVIIPIAIGAMTGYDNIATAWVNLDDTTNIVPVSSLERSLLVKGTLNETWSEPACEELELSQKLSRYLTSRGQECDCMLSNGTIYTAEQAKQDREVYRSWNPNTVNCKYDFPNNTQTWQDSGFIETNTSATYSCNSSFAVMIRNKTYDALDLKTEPGHCYNSIAYNDAWISDRSRCLPDVINQKYRWGFATTLCGLFVFVTSTWVVSMYIIWLYAQHNNILVRQGFRMTPLRAAFAMVKAAKQRTGLCEKGLVRKNTVELEKELYGGKGIKKTKLHYNIFVHDVEEGEDGLLATSRMEGQAGGQRRRDGYQLHPTRES